MSAACLSKVTDGLHSRVARDASHVYQLCRAISLFQEEGCHLLALGFMQVLQAEGTALIC